MHIKIFVENNSWGKKRKRKKPKAQIGTNVRSRVFNAGLLASGRSTGSRVSVVSLGPRANAELVTKIPSDTACFICSPPNGSIKNFALGWTILFMGDMGEGTWASRLGQSQMRQQYIVMGPVRL
jgi:hypothetical protein